MIKIQAEKIIVRGEKWLKIISIKALRVNDLPKEYTSGDPCVYSLSYGNVTCLCKRGNVIILSSKSQWEEDEFHKKLEYIRAAGKRLQEINARLKKKNVGWIGALEVII